jgi:subtilisin family serine protease
LIAEATSMSFRAWGIRFAGFSALLSVWTGLAWGVELPLAATRELLSGESVELLIEYEATAAEAEVSTRRKSLPRQSDDAASLALRAARYRALRDKVDAALGAASGERLKDYAHLPMTFRRFRTFAAARAYAAHPEVKAVYANEKLYPVLAQSLPLIGQPTVAAVGEEGAGTTVAVLDSRIDYARAEFGYCTAPGVPVGCKVVAAVTTGSGATSTAHGTNVAASVLGVAPGSRIAMLDVFSGSVAYTADVIEAIDWSIGNRSLYNIVALNMSLGDGLRYTTPCTSGNPYATPITNARNAGIVVVAAAGNNAFTDGIGKPACTPGAVSVGAVYDANIGGVTWGSNLCTDATTTADKVACFSNSASFLTLLAPGAMITAGGSSMGGTSQAAPHVAGAAAVLRAAFPLESPAETDARLIDNGKPLADPRNGIVTPRLDLPAAARPANDGFGAAAPLSGEAGSVTGTSLLATREAGEPQHAGDPGGHSVWWLWTAPAAGQVSLDTQGSGFDTLLAVYVGGDITTLQPVAANDNAAAAATSALLFQAQAGIVYRIAVDGANGEAGNTQLNWSLNTAALANLSLTASGSALGPAVSLHVLTVINAGPQAATGVRVTLELPAGASLLVAPPECLQSGLQVVCAVGTLASDGDATLTLQIGWDAGAPSAPALTASVASDLPDPVASDNNQIVANFFDVDSDGDVPTLPEWGMFLLTLLIAGMLAKRQA